MNKKTRHCITLPDGDWEYLVNKAREDGRGVSEFIRLWVHDMKQAERKEEPGDDKGN